MPLKRSLKRSSTGAVSAAKRRKVTPRSHPWPKALGVGKDPFPPTKIATLRYCDVIQLDAGATDAAVEHRYRANSIYDPDRTGTGHQPRFHDTFEALYENYEVLSSKITAAFNTTWNGVVSICGVSLDNDNSTAYTTRAALMENPNTSYRMIPSHGNAPAKISTTFNAKKSLGPANAVTNLATMGANPDENQDFVIWAINTYGTEDPGVVNVMITIDYTVRFSERKEVATS